MHERLLCIGTALVFVLFSSTALAHEYWLDPVESQLSVGDTLLVDVRNGEGFSGAAYPFDPTRLQTAELVSNKTRSQLAGRLGDYPAFQVRVSEPGLQLMRVDTRMAELEYESSATFEAFLAEHALDDIGKRHRERGLPLTDIVERYYRFCKSFISIGERALHRTGEQASALQAQGQRFELVPQGDPYQTDLLSIQVLLEGEPKLGRQVELYHRNRSWQVSRITAITDGQGLVSFDVSAEGDYLLNSVWLLESVDDSVHWESLWASMVFER